jgi:6-phosphogluconolactonase
MNISKPTIEEFPDLEGISRHAARMFSNLSEESVSATGRFVVALAGGNTPQRFYAILGSEMYREKILWKAVHFFWGDERFVPLDHKDSNYLPVYENLLSRVPVRPGNIHPVDTGTDSPAVSSQLYEREIRDFFRLKDAGVPRFDLVILGMGNDGHTASLFPGDKALREKIHLAAPVVTGGTLHSRITLTLPVINNAGNVLFLVSGEEKASTLKRVIEGTNPSLPASLVHPRNGRLIFLVDTPAGSLLKRQ